MMAFENYPTVHILDHPLIKHKITKLRDKTTKTSEFKMLVKEISVLEGYEAFGKTNFIAKPPTPAIKMTETTNKFLLSPRSTF